MVVPIFVIDYFISFVPFCQSSNFSHIIYYDVFCSLLWRTAVFPIVSIIFKLLLECSHLGHATLQTLTQGSLQFSILWSSKMQKGQMCWNMTSIYYHLIFSLAYDQRCIKFDNKLYPIFSTSSLSS